MIGKNIELSLTWPIDYSQQQVLEMVHELNQNEQAMLEILQRSPKVGVYKNQSNQDWSEFFDFYIQFLKSELGPRGECAKAIRSRLLADSQNVTKLLSPFDLTPELHIREIYMKIKAYQPCPEYSQIKKYEETRQKYLSNINKFQDESCTMIRHISQGLIKKHGENYDIKKHLSNLKLNYVQKFLEVEETLTRLRQIVNKCEGYHHLQAVQKYFQPYFVEWIIADSEIGRQNFKAGQLFQVRAIQKILPYIYHLQKNNKNWIFSEKRLEVFQNLTWIPKSLGSIDIALGYKDQHQDRYLITTLIQCRSRLFDIRQAYSQVSLEQEKGQTFEQLKSSQQQRQQIEKKVLQNSQPQQSEQEEYEQIQIKREYRKFLTTQYGPAELVQDHHFFIVTTLPQIESILPIESKLKESIEENTQNMFLEDIKSQPLYLYLKQRLENALSPLDWFKQYQLQPKRAYSNILVLK